MERITYKGESVTFSIFRKRIASEYQKYRNSPKDYMEVTLTYDEYLEQELFLALKVVSGWAEQITKMREAIEQVVKGYEGDGMEGMGTRDKVFYEICKSALTK